MFYFFEIYFVCEQCVIEIIQFDIRDNNKECDKLLLIIYFSLYI